MQQLHEASGALHGRRSDIWHTLFTKVGAWSTDEVRLLTTASYIDGLYEKAERLRYLVRGHRTTGREGQSERTPLAVTPSAHSEVFTHYSGTGSVFR
jgi:hypothetical protein